MMGGVATLAKTPFCSPLGIKGEERVPFSAPRGGLWTAHDGRSAKGWV